MLVFQAKHVLTWIGLNGLPYFNTYASSREAVRHANWLAKTGRSKIEYKRPGQRFQPMPRLVQT